MLKEIESYKFKYLEMRDSYGYYLWLLVYGIREIYGMGGVWAVIKRASEKSAQDKFSKFEMKDGKEQVRILGEILLKMCERFSSEFEVERAENFFYMRIENCRCLPPLTERAENFSSSGMEARALACSECMGSYKLASQKAGIRFRGRRTESGCEMSFEI